MRTNVSPQTEPPPPPRTGPPPPPRTGPPPPPRTGPPTPRTVETPPPRTGPSPPDHLTYPMMHFMSHLTPMNRMSDTRLWKRNLNSLRYAGGNNIGSIYFRPGRSKLCVTAAGFDAILPVITLGRTVSDTVRARRVVSYYALTHLAGRQLNTVNISAEHRSGPIKYGPIGYGNARKDNNTIDLLLKQ